MAETSAQLISSQPASVVTRVRPPLATQLLQDLYVLQRFTMRVGPYLLVLIFAAVLGWVTANSVSNYTHGGWELHIERRFNEQILINIHFHHWYYGIPLFFIALALIEWNAKVSLFVFGLGQSLSAHSFINEGGIPSIIEGGPTWHVPAYIYFPIVTAFSILYAFFLIRREEWVARAREREEIAASYKGLRCDLEALFHCVDNWARPRFTHKKLQQDKDTRIWYGEWTGFDDDRRGENHLHYTVMPLDPEMDLWVFRLEHVPMRGLVGQIDDWLLELDRAVQPQLTPVIMRDMLDERKLAEAPA